MSAEHGWIGEPPPPARDRVPGEEHKWRLMMGKGQFLSEEQKAELSVLREHLLPSREQKS